METKGTIDTNESTKSEGGNSRRLVLKTSLATIAAIGTGAMSSLAKAAPFAVTGSEATDGEILNFALNLEYLEAEFYLRAVYGHGVADADRGGSGTKGTVTGGSQVPFQNSAIRQYAKEIADDENNHVLFLRAALGAGHHVAEPSIDLQSSFNVLAQAAGLGDSFDPFANEQNFLLGAYVFEDVGVTAYHGAATLISNKTYLSAAAGILAVEAYHAGLVRLLCLQQGLTDQTNKISALRNKLSRAFGAPQYSDRGLQTNGELTLIPANANSIAYARTTSEVLNIVYAGGKANPGKGEFGFFPNKMNGQIN